MMGRSLALAFALASVVPLSPVNAAGPDTEAPTADQIAAIRAAEVLGREMYDYDQAAWYSTDRFMLDLQKAGLTEAHYEALGLRGYIVEPASDGLLLATYYREKNGQRSAYARYWMQGRAVTKGGIIEPDGDTVLSPLALRMIAAREAAKELALSENLGFCAQANPNSLVLPPRKDGSMPVFLMTPQIQNGSYPVGGHYRFDFDAQGKLVSRRSYMKTCIDATWSKGGAGFMMTHLLDPQPNEMQVFVSLYMPVPLVIATTQNGRLWTVSKGSVTPLEQPAKPGK